jgi:small GTP-binding protein
MKVVLVGDTKVGKTCLLNRLTTGSFRDTAATIGAAFQTHTLQTTTGSRTLQIWDTAGQEKYRSLAPMYYRAAQVALICFDLTNRESYEAVGPWADELAEKTSSDIQTIMVGNKADLTDARAITTEEARELAFEKGAAHYVECSAKSGDGVIDLFMKVADLMPGQTGAVSEAPPNIAAATAEGGGGCC